MKINKAEEKVFKEYLQANVKKKYTVEEIIKVEELNYGGYKTLQIHFECSINNGNSTQRKMYRTATYEEIKEEMEMMHALSLPD